MLASTHFLFALSSFAAADAGLEADCGQLFWNKTFSEGEKAAKPPLCRALLIAGSPLTSTDREYLNGMNPVYTTGMSLLDPAIRELRFADARQTVDVLLGMHRECMGIPRVQHVCRARYSIHSSNLRKIREGLPAQ